MTTIDTDQPTAPQAIEADPDRIQHLDPRELLMDKNIREAKPSPSLVSSVRDYGILQPIIAVLTGDGRARVHIGHRRNLAAIANEHATAPVIVRASAAEADAAEADRLAQQYVENTDRQGLTTGEQLDVFAGMAEMGMSAGEIARRTKARRRDVADGLKAARSAEVREAVTAAELTLEQAATLEEFSDQPEAYERLLEQAVNPRHGGSFAHLAQRLRDDRDQAAAFAALRAELDEAGVAIVEQSVTWHGPARRLAEITDAAIDSEPQRPALGADEHPDTGDGGPDLDAEEEDLDDECWDDDAVVPERPSGPPPIPPDEHAGCPGHAAILTTTYGGRGRGPQVCVIFVCTDPLGNGHRSITGRPLEAATGAAAATPRAGETEEQASERVAAEKAEKSAARRKVIAGNKAWDAAETVRRGWLVEFLSGKTPPKDASSWIAEAFLVDRYTVCRAAERGHSTAAELLRGPNGPSTSPADHQQIGKQLDGASQNRAVMITLGMVLGAIEGETSREQWRWIERGRASGPDAGLVRYLTALQGWGYGLAPIERLAIGEPVDDTEVFDVPAPTRADTADAAEADADHETDAEDQDEPGEADAGE